MIIAEMVRPLGKNVFLLLVALCMVGVFSFVSFGDEATTGKPATENQAAGTGGSRPAGIERAGQATSNGVERAGKAAGRGIERAGKATGKGIKKGGEAVEKSVSGTDPAKEQPQRQ